MLTSETELESSLDGEGRDADDAKRLGEVLDGKYELMRKIGEGGMGEVYEARHVQLGRRFAVKLLRPELLGSSRMLRRFSREVLAVSRLENDHLVPALDCGYTPQGGRVTVGAELWGALSKDGAPLRAGTRVRVASVVGTRVIVEPIGDPTAESESNREDAT